MGKRKLTDHEVKLCRALYSERQALIERAAALTIRSLAKKFEVSYTTMYDLLHYSTYK